MVYKEAVTLTSADKSLVCAIRMGATEKYQTTSSPSFLARSIAQWGKKIRLACSAELRDWGTVHLHQFFSHCFFYAREGRRMSGTACSLEHCFYLVPCEVFKFFSFFLDETLVFDHLLHSCRVTFYNAFWRFNVFFSAFYYLKEQFSLRSDEEEKHQRRNGSPSFLQWSVNVMSDFLF